MSPLVPLVSLPVVLHAALRLVAPVFAVSVTFLVLLAVAIGSRPLCPSLPIVRRVESSVFLGKGRSLRPRLPGGVAPLAPTRGSRHITQTGPYHLLAMNTNLPLARGPVMIRRGPMVGLQLACI